MSKGKAFVEFIRIFISIIATVVGIISFFLMIIINDTYESWLKSELMLLGVFVLSMIICAIAEDPNRLFRHVFAITFCILAFAYRRLKIQNEFTYHCNKVRRDVDGYPKAYRFALSRYDEKECEDSNHYEYK